MLAHLQDHEDEDLYDTTKPYKPPPSEKRPKKLLCCDRCHRWYDGWAYLQHLDTCLPTSEDIIKCPTCSYPYPRNQLGDHLQAHILSAQPEDDPLFVADSGIDWDYQDPPRDMPKPKPSNNNNNNNGPNVPPPPPRTIPPDEWDLWRILDNTGWFSEFRASCSAEDRLLSYHPPNGFAVPRLFDLCHTQLTKNFAIVLQDPKYGARKLLNLLMLYYLGDRIIFNRVKMLLLKKIGMIGIPCLYRVEYDNLHADCQLDVCKAILLGTFLMDVQIVDVMEKMLSCGGDWIVRRMLGHINAYHNPDRFVVVYLRVSEQPLAIRLRDMLEKELIKPRFYLQICESAAYKQVDKEVRQSIDFAYKRLTREENSRAAAEEVIDLTEEYYEGEDEEAYGSDQEQPDWMTDAE
jgi:hypothetical protein